MLNNLDRVRAFREAGAVSRCHALDHSTRHNIAQHSYGALTLLLVLHPEPSLELVKTLLWHDAAERWLGDLPATAKWGNRELKSAYEEAERRVLKALWVFPKLLAPAEQDWVKACDTLDLWFWCREQQALGNQLLGEWVTNCEAVLNALRTSERLPSPVADLYDAARARPHSRLTDFFEEFARGKPDGPRKAEK